MNVNQIIKEIKNRILRQKKALKIDPNLGDQTVIDELDFLLTLIKKGTKQMNLFEALLDMQKTITYDFAGKIESVTLEKKLFEVLMDEMSTLRRYPPLTDKTTEFLIHSHHGDFLVKKGGAK